MTNKRGRYELQQELGRGAAGTVWVAWDTQLERRVAIKLLHADSQEEGGELNRFELEARAIAQLKSPHIVNVYDVGASDGQPFMVMELLEGESLEARLTRHVHLPLSVTIGIVGEVCRGLITTHRAGIIHRDIKPANIFLAREGGRELAKLLDFGVATLIAQAGRAPAERVRGEGAPSGYWVGTPQYMSPEQIAAEPLDERIDLWSLAVTAFRMLTGQCPFNAHTLPALQQQVRTGSFQRPSALVPSLGPAVDEFFERALAKSPAVRFQTGEELATALRALEKAEAPVTRILFLDDEPDMELLLRQRFRRQVRDGLYELHFATDGRGGLDQLRRRPDIDVVLTDLNMPGMDGLTFLRHVPEVNPLIRVVVVSAYGDMANIRAAMNRGAFDFLGKPIDFDDLQTTIEKVAAHVNVVRAALQSSEENQLMRVLLGQGVAERWLNALRSTDSPSQQTVAATVAFIDVHGFARGLNEPFPHNALERLNHHFTLFLHELLAKEGKVIRFVGDAVLAVFDGDDHLRRALDASLAIRSRLRVQPTRGEARYHGVSVGLASGTIMMGPTGSLALGHIEPSVLGEPVSTAARLQSLAGEDEVLISSAQLPSLAGEYHCEPDPRRTVATANGGLPVACVIRRKEIPQTSVEVTAAVAPPHG